MTPHISAKKEDIAKTVLMPGDPLRAKYIAETYLKDYKLVSSIRNIYAYTGYYNNKLITIMASGMGMPSMGIYSYELYKFYDVENIIRIGSAGAYSKDIDLYSVILCNESYSLSSYARVQNGYDKNIIESDSYLNEKIKEAANKLDKKIIEGRVYSSDVFYGNANINDLYENKKCLCVEMESFALFHNAKVLNKKAACILTISDNLITKEETTPIERQNSFNDMMLIALEASSNI